MNKINIELQIVYFCFINYYILISQLFLNRIEPFKTLLTIFYSKDRFFLNTHLNYPAFALYKV